MSAKCPIRIACSTKAALLELSLIKDDVGHPCEPYDSIIRRACVALKTQQSVKRIDVSKL